MTDNSNSKKSAIVSQKEGKENKETLTYAAVTATAPSVQEMFDAFEPTPTTAEHDEKLKHMKMDWRTPVGAREYAKDQDYITPHQLDDVPAISQGDKDNGWYLSEHLYLSDLNNAGKPIPINGPKARSIIKAYLSNFQTLRNMNHDDDPDVAMNNEEWSEYEEAVNSCTFEHLKLLAWYQTVTGVPLNARRATKLLSENVVNMLGRQSGVTIDCFVSQPRRKRATKSPAQRQASEKAAHKKQKNFDITKEQSVEIKQRPKKTEEQKAAEQAERTRVKDSKSQFVQIKLAALERANAYLTHAQGTDQLYERVLSAHDWQTNPSTLLQLSGMKLYTNETGKKKKQITPSTKAAEDERLLTGHSLAASFVWVIPSLIDTSYASYYCNDDYTVTFQFSVPLNPNETQWSSMIDSAGQFESYADWAPAAVDDMMSRAYPDVEDSDSEDEATVMQSLYANYLLEKRKSKAKVSPKPYSGKPMAKVPAKASTSDRKSVV